MGTIGFVGGGNIAEAMIKAIISARLFKPQDVLVSDIRPDRLEYLAKTCGVTTTADNSELAGRVQTLILSIKPRNMTDALESVKDTVRADALIISIAAGKNIASITSILTERPVIRAMPNTPALIGQAITALCPNQKAKQMLDKAKEIFSAVGQVVVIDDEDLMDAVTAVSGSGPAYYFRVSESLIKAAVNLGLPQEIAKKLVLQTAKGAALMAVEQDCKGHTLQQLRHNVTSPGGTTEAALKILDKQDTLDTLFADATKAARDRARQLSG